MTNFDTRFINFLTILLMLGLISGFTSCQKAPNNQFGSTPKTEANIMGGNQVQDENQLSKKVIYLALGVEKKRTQFGFTISQKGHCTASAISRRILITAAHCVKEFTKEQIFAVMTNNPWNHQLNLNEWISVEKLKVHEKFVGKDRNLSDDLALLKLTREIEPERVSKIVDSSQVNAEFLNILAIGYGKTSALNSPGLGDDENNPTRAQAQPTLLHSVNKEVESFDPTAKIFQIDQADFKGICQGDSGGPGYLFDQAQQDFFILGITTFVSIFSNEKDQRDPNNIYSSCIGRGNYTNLLVYKDWITSTLTELN